MLQFKTSNNQSVSQTFNVKNAGNIDMKLLLGVIEFQDHFTVDPSQVTIRAGHQATVTASFLPTCDLNVDVIETYVQLKLICNYFTYMAYYLVVYFRYYYS